MPRQLRLEYPGAMYHVMGRGNRREKIFLDDVDRQELLKTLAEACQKTGWQTLRFRGGLCLGHQRHGSVPAGLQLGRAGAGGDQCR
jgi:hypothetical protein